MTETARIYGGSLYDLAAEENLTGEILGQMEQIRTLLRENPEYERLLSEPSIPQMERNGMIEAAFGGQAQRYLVNFMKLMCEKNLLGEYSGCFEAFKSRYYEDHNIAEAVVTSVCPLSEEQQKRLKEKLKKISGKEIILIQKTDPALLAGVRVELDGKLAGRNGEEPDFGDFRQDSSCNSVGGKHATETRRNIQSHPKSDQVL